MIDMTKGDTALIVDECKKRGVLRNQCAYVLATVALETDRTMKPIREYGKNAYFKKMYDIKGSRPKKARELGNVHPGDGVKFHGRGYVQLTGRTNYKRATDKLGVDFIARPDDVMKPEHAVKILVVGMLEGWFTGKKLSHYITLQKSDFTNARRIINGTDRMHEIAAIAQDYDARLKEEGYGLTVPKPRPRPEVEVLPSISAPPPPKPNTFWIKLAALLGRLFHTWRKS